MTTIDKHPGGHICWVDLMTPDPEKARTFYASLFGWSYDVSGPELGHYAMAKLTDKNVAGVGSPPPGTETPAVWSVYFATDNVDETIEKVKANGGNVVMGPMVIPGQGKMAVFVDSTGVAFGAWQPLAHTGAQKIDEPGAMFWHECNTAEPAKARDFYCKVFGLEPHKLDDPKMEYYTLHKGPKTVGGVMKLQKEGIPPHWAVYFAVADSDAAAKKVAELGGKVLAPGFDTPYGRISYVTDPTGAAFALVTPPKKS